MFLEKKSLFEQEALQYNISTANIIEWHVLNPSQFEDINQSQSNGLCYFLLTLSNSVFRL